MKEARPGQIWEKDNNDFIVKLKYQPLGDDDYIWDVELLWVSPSPSTPIPRGIVSNFELATYYTRLIKPDSKRKYLKIVGKEKLGE